MIPYSTEPKFIKEIGTSSISTFQDEVETNIDWCTVDSFGSEWEKFNAFTTQEIEQIGNDYFDIIPKNLLNDAMVLDMGCGSGRWSKFLAKKVKFIEAIDPSESVITACSMLQDESNVRVTQASSNNIPFPDESFDLVISLGVLHHIPDTQKAMDDCVKKIKNGGVFLVYLYYDLDNRGFVFKLIFKISALFRAGISKCPAAIKKTLCDLIALIIYWPFSRISALFKTLGSKSFYKKIPLSYYGDKSMTILRNDSLDRFGTPLEQRFSKQEINIMMEKSGLTDMVFSQNAPYWHAMGYKR